MNLCILELQFHLAGNICGNVFVDSVTEVLAMSGCRKPLHRDIESNVAMNSNGAINGAIYGATNGAIPCRF